MSSPFRVEPPGATGIIFRQRRRLSWRDLENPCRAETQTSSVHPTQYMFCRLDRSLAFAMNVHVFLLVVTASIADPASQDEVTEVERHAMRYRDAIRSGHVLVSTIYEEFAETPDGDAMPGIQEASPTRRDYEFWWDGADRKTITRYARGGDNSSTATAEAQIRGLDFVLSHDLTDRAEAVTLYPEAASSLQSLRQDIDPRGLGLFNDSIEQTIGRSYLDGSVGYPSRRGTVVARDGHLHRVSFVSTGSGPRESQANLWFDPAKGYNPVRLENTTSFGEFRLRWQTEVDLVRIDDVWFPNRIVFEQSRAEGSQETFQVKRRQTVDVEAFQFNRPLAQDTFAPATIDVHPDDMIRFKSADGRDYRELRFRDEPSIEALLRRIGRSGSRPAATDALASPADGSRWWWIGTLSALGVLMAVYWWIRPQADPTTRPKGSR